MAVAGLILGILSLVGGMIPGVNAFPMWLFGIVGIILSTIARKREKSGIATAGLVLSIIGTILALSLWVACLVCVGAAGAAGMLGL
jgi:vacuolar-type H+-ATPase subunit I/STV1